MAFRPEHTGPAENFYDEKESAKYHSSSRIVRIQTELAQRCIELLNLPEGKQGLVLDIGCGSGLSGEVLQEAGHAWVGTDVSPKMLEIANDKEEANGDVMLHDMGMGMPFRPGCFDGAISVSAVQWLSYSNDASHTPRKRLHAFFSTLYSCLKRGARAVLQLYPESPEQMEMISGAAMKCGFGGGLVVDFPNSAKAKKCYLCLFAGQDVTTDTHIPAALGTEAAGVDVAKRKQLQKQRRRPEKASVKSRGWVKAKKDRQRKQGKDVRPDSKYTARRRAGKGW
jgi:18S rRNA (guanine1575-N7)-methyltransferase